MMNSAKILILSSLALGVSGCAGYSNFVNSFAPAKQPSAFAAESGEMPQPVPGASPFCPAPPPPPAPAVSEVYMVMPEEGGKAGTVAVTFNDGQETVLHGDYSAMTLAGDDKKTFVGNQEQLQQTFGTAVAALPPAPNSAILYFQLGKTELTPESKTEAEQIYNDFVTRKAPEIVVIGHTDTVGSEAHNLKLSIKRAEKVRDSLISLGVPAQSIQTSGTGEHNLIVETPDNTREPKNRCVEISVR